MKRQDILENQVNIVYLGLGSNLGNKILNLNKAMHLIIDNNTKIIKVSSFYETVSWPNKFFPKYVNIVIKLKTDLNPLSLFKKIKKIEKYLGRKNRPKNYPRECDIDILDFNQKKINMIFKNDKISIPHQRMQNRSFVLLPMFEITKNWRHPISGKKINDLLSKISHEELTTIKHI